jgi:NAD-dependent DNA ligase
LVVADSDSMSTKARKARELGIRIVSEAVFLQLLATGELPA